MAFFGESFDDPKTIGILALASGLMQGRGGQGILEMARLMGPEGQAQRQMAQLQLRKGRAETDELERRLRDDDEARSVARDFYTNRGLPSGAPRQSGDASTLPQYGATGQGTQMPWRQGDVTAGVPMPYQQAVPPKANTFEQYKALGDAYAARGLVNQAQQAWATAEKFRPKFNTTPQWMRDASGNTVPVLIGEGGETQTLNYRQKPDIQFLNLGGSERAVDKNALTGNESYQRTVSPDTVYSGNVTMRGQNLTDQRAREFNQITQQGNVVKNETELRKEFADLPEVKNYKLAFPSYKAITEAATRNNPQADINLIYGLAKLYDPTSVVREGEYATIANSQAIPEWLKGMAQNVAGGGRLTPQTKQQILQEARGRIVTYQNEYEKARGTYGNIAGQRGVSSSNVFTPVGEPVAQPLPQRESEWRPGSRYQLRDGRIATFDGKGFRVE